MEIRAYVYFFCVCVCGGGGGGIIMSTLVPEVVI